MFPAIFLLASIILASAQAPSAPGKPLPPGPMQPKIKAACIQCHNATRISEQHLTRQQWSDQLEKMPGSFAQEGRLCPRTAPYSFSALAASSAVGYFSGRSNGNRITSLMVCESVNSIASRSTPSPTPPAGGMP
jgi:hypothetical protein